MRHFVVFLPGLETYCPQIQFKAPGRLRTHFARILDMKTLLLTTVIMLGLSTAAQETDDPARPTLGKTGQLFTIKFTPKSKRLDIGLAGKEAAALDPQRLIVFGRVIEGEGAPRTLRIEPNKSHFTVMDELKPGAQVEFEVKDRATNKQETLRLQSKP